MIDDRLLRGVGLRAAISLNMSAMIGIGPLITVPLVLGALHGPLSLLGWLAGALLALCDGYVWAQLATRFPGSGGTYGFLREAFGRTGAGRFAAFLFVWQTIFSAPLLQASGYIGFANYAGYLVPALAEHRWAIPVLAAAVGVATLAALYRAITDVSRVASVLAVAAGVTIVTVIAASFAHFSAAQAFAHPGGDSLLAGLRAGFGQALIIAMYDYAGYGTSAMVGGEVRTPSRTIPRAIYSAIGIVALLYLAMQTGILGALPWAQIVPHADGSLPPLGQHLASAIVERSFGAGAAVALTLLVLVTAFASVYANLLAFSRIPFAAAGDGVFLPAFAHVHPRLRFPDVSLVAIGLLALPACFLPLDAIINALTTSGVLIGAIVQIAALFAVLRREGGAWNVRCFPFATVVALAGWVFIFVSSGTIAIAYGLATIAAGAAVYAVWARRSRAWPFAGRAAA